MPEGPSIVILKQATDEFAGRKIVSVSGNSKQEIKRMEGLTVRSIKSWGKHYLLSFDGFTLRIHFLLFGSYRINAQKESKARLSLFFDEGELHFYACSLQFLEGSVDSHYDWTSDVMNEHWNPKAAFVKLLDSPDQLICDALLEQDIFAGVGNIIKNEILYRVKIHPESLNGKIPKQKLRDLVKQSVVYSFEFLHWKNEFVLKKRWLVYAKKHACDVTCH